MKQIVQIYEQDNIYCDAMVWSDKDDLLFGSFYGRNTALQQFLARLELPSHEAGINKLTFKMPQSEQVQIAHIKNAKSLYKKSAKIINTIYGKDLSHVFIYDCSTQQIDYANNKAIVIYKSKDKPIDTLQIWELIKEVSEIPLLDIWSKQIINHCYNKDYIKEVIGFGGISVLILTINMQEFEESITGMIRSFELHAA